MKINLSYSNWLGHTPLHYALAHKDNFKHGKDLQLNTVKVAGVGRYGIREELLKKAKLDIIAQSTPGAIRMLANEPDLARIVFFESRSNGAEGVIVSDEIDKLEDLKDKRIGSPAEVGLYYVGFVLKQNGIKCRNVQWELDTDLKSLSKKFNKREIDAICTYEPHLSELSNKAESKTLFTTADYSGDDNGVFVVRKEFLEKNESALIKFLEWYLDALVYIKNHLLDEVAIFQSQKTGWKFKKVQKILGKYLYLDMKENLKYLQKINFEKLCAELEISLEVAKEIDDLSGDFELKKILAFDILNNISIN
jgi:ABC-type nitrate/sulfonate/bicarbonate transport system substrate-binding protein